MLFINECLGVARRSQERERGLEREETVFTRALDWASRLPVRLLKVRKLFRVFVYVLILFELCSIVQILSF